MKMNQFLELNSIFVCIISFVCHNKDPQVRIAGTENTVQYWTSLGMESRPMLLGQYQRLNRPNVVSVLAPYIGISNLPSVRRSLAQQWYFTGPRVAITLENHVGSRKSQSSAQQWLVTQPVIIICQYTGTH